VLIKIFNHFTRKDDNFGEQKSAFAPAEREDLKKWLDETSDVRVRLALPRWNQTSFPEFKTEEARQYFKNKKEGNVTLCHLCKICFGGN